MEIGRGSHDKKNVCDNIIIIVFVRVFRLTSQMLNHFELFVAAENEKSDDVRTDLYRSHIVVIVVKRRKQTGNRIVLCKKIFTDNLLLLYLYK